MSQHLIDKNTTLFGVWSEKHGWLSYYGQVLVSNDREDLAPYLGDRREIRPWGGFLHIKDMPVSQSNEARSDFWKV